MITVYNNNIHQFKIKREEDQEKESATQRQTLKHAEFIRKRRINENRKHGRNTFVHLSIYKKEKKRDINSRKAFGLTSIIKLKERIKEPEQG